jgi:hypothetical protein
MIVAKRDAYKNILVKQYSNNDLMFIKKGIKIVDDYKIEVYYFINIQTRSCYWVMNRIQITMLGSSYLVKMGQVIKERGRGTQVKCRYDNPVILAIHDWQQESNAQLFSAELGYLSGSNIHGENSNPISCFNLCLGVVPDKWSINMVDALLFGKPNNDLPWRGGAMTGYSAWAKDINGKRIKIFNVENWPEITKCKTIIPREIQDCANALKK